VTGPLGANGGTNYYITQCNVLFSIGQIQEISQSSKKIDV
jgi:hypothetical protein